MFGNAEFLDDDLSDPRMNFARPQSISMGVAAIDRGATPSAVELICSCNTERVDKFAQRWTTNTHRTKHQRYDAVSTRCQCLRSRRERRIFRTPVSVHFREPIAPADASRDIGPNSATTLKSAYKADLRFDAILFRRATIINTITANIAPATIRTVVGSMVILLY